MPAEDVGLLLRGMGGPLILNRRRASQQPGLPMLSEASVSLPTSLFSAELVRFLSSRPPCDVMPHVTTFSVPLGRLRRWQSTEIATVDVVRV